MGGSGLVANHTQRAIPKDPNIKSPTNENTKNIVKTKVGIIIKIASFLALL